MTEDPSTPGGPDPCVAVVGTGWVGSCLAAAMADRGLDVVGVDTDAGRVAELNAGRPRFAEPGLAEQIGRARAAGRLRFTTDGTAVSAADVVVITVGTPVGDDGSLADDQLRAACRSLGDHIRPGQLVVLKSTVPPGTTRGLVAPLLEGGRMRAGVDFLLAFTPERLAESTAMAELRRLPIVVGGLDEPSTAAAVAFWRRALGVTVTAQDSLEAAEIVKLADNWWIDLNIALANELAKFCDLYRVDVLDVIAAANAIPKGAGYVNILAPSAGVGGSCLTKDPWMVWRSARQRGLEIHSARVGREVNDAMPAYTAQLILDGLAEAGRDPAGSVVAVLGVAYKNNTADLRETPARAVVETLAKAGVEVRVHDPVADPAEVAELLGIRPCRTVDEAVRAADCVAILALHGEFRDIDFANLPVARPCLVLDGRAYYPKATIAKLRRLGFRYRGIGR
ncbi:nucleotide sugar dehydrogenase [Rhizomonospora bruguierae]|uniref:nucleotide sugar dehydrogenase n=1 Tax=Rhizomonospora bruguierae TaxID=1581705 RepID=UPI001BCE3DE3|nr:nucleotide sugar dehydrogenase [Micromonospora sp. NBRC 107566]